ncbi:MAG TPA: M28 family metallopeptidase [Verrucomicrobiae bacterium]
MIALAGFGVLQCAAVAESAIVDQLIDAETNSSFAYDRLATLCDTFGPRFSGTTNLEAAIDWILAQMKSDGLENVHGEDVMVPHWVRGAESAEMLLPRPHNLPMLGLGGSVGTPAGGITSDVLVVNNFAELTARASEAAGKIVLFDVPFVTYGETVRYRGHGAIEAARVGAVACLVRSITPFSIQSPHTGAMSYSNGIPKIPSAAITVEDAEMMQRMADRGERVVVRLSMSAMTLPDVPSRNVVAEVVGSEKPEEVVIVSGHIDSWDVGQGAMDDGGGAMTAWETARLMHKLGLRPRRTVRVVLWVNEENGTAGARGYEKRHKSEMPQHVLAIECDRGTFRPLGFSFVGCEAGRQEIEKFLQPLERIGAGKLFSEGSETDVEQLEKDGVPLLALVDDETKYFWYHHTQADTMDKLKPDELAGCCSAMAAMAWEAADAQTAIPRVPVK